MKVKTIENNIPRLIFAALLGILLFSTPASAYEMTDATATKLTDRSSLFTISYRFGFLNREAELPMMTSRDGQKGTIVGYSLVDKDGKVVQTGEAPGVVLSKASLNKDRGYEISRGKNADFTLVVITRDVPMTNDLRLVVNHLPFFMIEGGLGIGASVPKDTLTSYQTPLAK